jgi:hypothetical protein
MQRGLSEYSQTSSQQGVSSNSSLPPFMIPIGAQERRTEPPSNAYGNQHRVCLEGTREKTLADIRKWINRERNANWMYCLIDVAGSGKSTVAKHMAEEWKREGRLVARFFFSRDTTETMSTSSFCWTVANAFATLNPHFKTLIYEFKKRPDLGLLSFEDLFSGLIAGPLRVLNRPAILIIDALDECNNEYGGRDQLLNTLCDQRSFIPLLRTLATGRPERDIKGWAIRRSGVGYTNFVRLEEDGGDIRRYIKHRLQDLPNMQDHLYSVIRQAEGLFIWARIACDLLLQAVDVNGLLETLGKEVKLDSLYKIALTQSMPEDEASQAAMITVLQMILSAREPLSIVQLDKLAPKQGIVEPVVTRLSSLLLHRGHEDPIRLLHATLREFLTTQTRAGKYYIQPGLGHYALASGCISIISNQSKQDLSNLSTLNFISAREDDCVPMRYLLTIYSAFFIIPQSHGYITVQCRAESWA